MQVLDALAGRMRVFALTSSPDRRDVLRAAGAVPLIGNLDHPQDLRRLRGLADYVLMLAPPPAQGSDDPRSAHLATALRRPAVGLRAARSSRPQACNRLRALRKSLIVAKPAHPGIDAARRVLQQATIVSRTRKVAYASTTGVYGDAAGARIDERRLPQPGTDRAKRRVSAEATWRGIAPARARAPHLEMAAWRAVVLRIPGIYGQGRLPLERLQRGLPRLHPEEDVYTNHIEIGDLARSAVAALWRGSAQRVIHACDGQEMKMGDYFDAVADAASLPRPPRLSAAEVKAAVSPAMWSFMSESRRLLNDRLKGELRVKLRFPTVESALQTWYPAGSGQQDDTQC
jgi:nucleoside-diphosphate-sugar epimerase